MRDRPVVDIIILTFLFTVCAFIICAGATWGYLLIFKPDVDVDRLGTGLLALITGITGALLGLITGTALKANGAQTASETGFYDQPEVQAEPVHQRTDPGNIAPTWNEPGQHLAPSSPAYDQDAQPDDGEERYWEPGL